MFFQQPNINLKSAFKGSPEISRLYIFEAFWKGFVSISSLDVFWNIYKLLSILFSLFCLNVLAYK